MKKVAVAACVCFGLSSLEACVGVTHEGTLGHDAGPGEPSSDASSEARAAPDSTAPVTRDGGGAGRVGDTSVEDSGRHVDGGVTREAGKAPHDAASPMEASPPIDAGPSDVGVAPPKDSGPTCPSGELLCSGACVDTQSDPGHCGGCGTVCPGVPDGVPSCGGGSCGFVCSAGYHACGGACADDTSVESCGSSCSPCVPPLNASATCSGASCGFTCNPGTVSCAGGTACCTVNTIAAGDEHTCLLTSPGVECAGSGSSGQLGDGSTATCAAPCSASVSGTMVSVVAASSHTCALSDAGTVTCWGDGTSGDLGDGSTAQKKTPTAVSGLSGVIAISAGHLHTCALLASGEVDCWGDNTQGQLGTGTTVNSSTAQSVSGVSGAVAISAGYQHTCAVTVGGTVWCWGDNTDAELGTGSTTPPSLTPVAVSGLTGAVAVAAGAGFTCALTSAGGVWCWGANVCGELGNGSTVTGYVPGEISASSFGGSSVVAISAPAAGVQACALTAAGEVWCWGYNVDGQLGDGTTTNRSTPVKPKLPSGATATAIGTGSYHACAAVTGAPSSFYCWGDGADDQLGDASTSSPEKKPIATLF